MERFFRNLPRRQFGEMDEDEKCSILEKWKKNESI